MKLNRNLYTAKNNSGALLTRRSLLRRAACVAAAWLSRGAGMAAEPVSPVMAKLTSHMSEARDRALPGEVIEKAKHHVLDTFAAMPRARRGFTLMRTPRLVKT